MSTSSVAIAGGRDDRLGTTTEAHAVAAMPTAMSPVIQVHEEEDRGSGLLSQNPLSRPESTAMPTTQRHAASLTEAINKANAASSAAAEAELRKEQHVKPLHERSRIE